MTNVKGTALVGTVRYITEHFGPEGIRTVLEELSAEDRALVESGVLVSAWYPFSLLMQISRVAHKHFGAERPDIYRELGKASAEYALTTIYKIFFKVGSPQFIISRGSALFKTYYTTGELKAVQSEKGHAVIDFVGFEEPAPEFCERLEGWMQRTVELSGGKDLRIAHLQCVNRGDAVCRFEGYWS